MPSSRDSSVWRTLAAAFGDGLAFGVGVALTRNAAQLAAARSATPELESKARFDLETFTAQARSQAEADMQSLREQMAAVHEDFAQTVARLVDDQIAATIAARWHASEGRLRETIREEIRLNNRDQQIAELRERVERQERNLLNLVMALGQSCLQAAEHISPEEVPPPLPPATDPELPALA
jgi:hypothetical protein